jgi:TM2 domain-containing membrane protein YozV
MFTSTEQIQPSDPPKNPIVAALLSFILLGGVGQIYLGQTKKGIIIMVVTLILSCIGIGLITWIVGVVDAYIMADKLQKGEAIGDMQWFWES